MLVVLRLVIRLGSRGIGDSGSLFKNFIFYILYLSTYSNIDFNCFTQSTRHFSAQFSKPITRSPILQV